MTANLAPPPGPRPLGIALVAALRRRSRTRELAAELGVSHTRLKDTLAALLDRGRFGMQDPTPRRFRRPRTQPSASRSITITFGRDG